MAEFSPKATIDSKLSPSPPNSKIFEIIIHLSSSSVFQINSHDLFNS